MATTAAILLSAGESTRMGETKALLPWRDITLVEHQVGALTSAGLSPIVVVLGHQSDKLESLLGDRAGVECVYNPDYIHGKATSVKAGVVHCDGSMIRPPTPLQWRRSSSWELTSPAPVTPSAGWWTSTETGPGS